MDVVIVLTVVEPLRVGVAELNVVVEGVGGVVEGHGLASFSTLHVELQYAVKHQPSPSVLLYMKLPTRQKDNAVQKYKK